MKKTLKLGLQVSLPIIFFSGIITAGVFFQPQKKANFPKNFSNEIKKPLLNEINYLALGDFLSAGFDWNNNLDGRGNMVNGSITGISFPAFFVNFAQIIKSDSVKSFKNLALNDSGILDWLYFLEPKNNFLDKARLNNFKAQIYNKSRFTEIIRSVFGDFSSSFPKLIEEIKKANLISISLGFKDFLDAFNSQFFDDLKLSSLKENRKNTDFVLKVDKIFTRIEANLERIITIIKKINPKAHINLIEYYQIQPKIQKYLQDLAENYLIEINDNNLSIYRLNKLIQKVAQKTGVNYINPFRGVNSKLGDEFYFDSHMNFRPQIKGSKQIAQNLILSLTLGKNQINSLSESKDHRIHQTNFSSDLNENQQINLAPDKEILEKLSLNGSLLNFVKADSNFEKESIQALHTFKKEEKTNFSAKDFLSKITPLLDSQESPFVKLVNEIIDTFGNEANPNFEAFNNIIDIIFKSNFVTNLLQVAQSYLFNSSPTNQTNSKTEQKKPDLLTYLKSTVLTEKEIVKLLIEVFASPYVQKHQNETISLFYNLFFRQKKIIKLIISSFAKDPVYQEIISQVLDFNTLQKFVIFILTELIKNNKDYSTVRSFKDLLSLFLQNSNNYNKSITFIRNFVIEAFKQTDFLKNVLNLLLNKWSFSINHDDQASLVSLISSISDILTRTKTFKNLINLISSEIILGLKLNSEKNSSNLGSFLEILTNLPLKIQNFFKEKDNIFNLSQDILHFSPSVRQLDAIKAFIDKILPFITKIKIKLTDFLGLDSNNFTEINLVFEAFVKFLSENNFQQLSKLIKAFLESFFVIDSLKYRNSLDFNGIIFNLISNNSEIIKQIFLDFAITNKNNTQILGIISSIFLKMINNNAVKHLQGQETNTFDRIKIYYLIDTFLLKIKELTNQYNINIAEINSKLGDSKNSLEFPELIKKRDNLKTFLNINKLKN
ncbi:SGNH/GDSL hydrolase family protein [Mesomycoplasma hyopneumoniae]|uniref:SGNH/GDSL hydrolase family protein n=1 Tax=Mesomycoplasma hyopneumoniae TaxID=2099 RepID=UPI00136A4DEE|nr:SGNH/GDSL hydrolase family protein [Mesomycoplasma hyopneumoniae]MXR56993.1 SGNH/GDSL hydrolase family protein [Mesomycoplasma hyopneumoniae]